MKRLYGKTILIGREPSEKRRLMISVNADGQQKSGVSAQAEPMPDSVSRCLPANDTAHCKIIISSTGEMTLENIKASNETYVDGLMIKSKVISDKNAIALGKDRYALDINAVLDMAKKLTGAAKQPSDDPQPSVAIDQLKLIWEEYERKIYAIQVAQQKKNKRRQLPMMISLSATILSGILIPALGSAATVITIILAVVSLYILIKNYKEEDTSYQDKKEVKDWLTTHYICPKCGHFLGEKSFIILEQDKRCLYCQCRWERR